MVCVRVASARRGHLSREMGKNSKGGKLHRKQMHEHALEQERQQEAERAAKRAKKLATKAAEEAAAEVGQVTEDSMDVERKRLGKKQLIGVRSRRGGIVKPSRIMKKTLKKMAKRREMEL